MTYGRGGIHSGSLRPELCFDLVPKHAFVQQADVRALPLRSGAVSSVIFDPPFLAGGGASGRMHQQYSSLESVPKLLRFYEEALAELLRILGPGGVLVFKCQDINNGRTQGFSHCEIYNTATRLGFYALDLFVLVASHRMRPYGMQRQDHARKANCYFWVFKKAKKKNYRLEGHG